jgi:cardiolipin synthase
MINWFWRLLSTQLKTNIPTHENIYTIPNILTFSRLLASPYIGYLIVNEKYPLALGIFAVAGITDMVSGTFLKLGGVP